MTNCTNKNNCIRCVLAGYCLHLKSKAVTRAEMENLAFINDALSFAYGLNFEPAEVTLGFKLDFKPAEWKLFIHEAYAEYRGRIIGADGNEEFLNTDELFEVSDEKFDASVKELSNAYNAIRDWLKYYFCEPRIITEDTYFRGNTEERLRVVFSIIRARYPHESQFFGLSGKAANDNAY